ncbi:MAG: hypothetical protein MUE94_13230 [Verrucomicrobia bacterium]|jgi:alpha-glucosidase|nr:hypothetical protein [Verrucomicrobiota bacterium]
MACAPPAPGQVGFAYGLFFNNPSQPVFRLGTQSQFFGGTNVWSFEAGEGQLDYFFFGGGPDHTMNQVLQRYAELTGSPTLPPKWAFGYHLSRWSY